MNEPDDTRAKRTDFVEDRTFADIREEIRDNEELNHRLGVVEIESRDTLRAQILNTITGLSIMRMLEGKPPIPPSDIANALEQMDRIPKDRPGGGFSIEVGEVGTPGHFAIAGVFKQESLPAIIEQGGLKVPVTQDLKDAVPALDGNGKFFLLHEVAHAIGAGTGDEAAADAAMFLTRIRDGEPDMVEKMDTAATIRILQFNPDRDLAADAILRLKHSAEQTPELLSGVVDGKSLIDIQKMGSVYQKTSEATVPDMEKYTAAIEYAKQATLSTTNGQPPPEIPTDLDRAGATAILRAQMAVEDGTEFGTDNNLTRSMSALWAANPQAFMEAQAYMEASYGIVMDPPDGFVPPELGSDITEPVAGIDNPGGGVSIDVPPSAPDRIVIDDPQTRVGIPDLNPARPRISIDPVETQRPAESRFSTGLVTENPEEKDVTAKKEPATFTTQDVKQAGLNGMDPLHGDVRPLSASLSTMEPSAADSAPAARAPSTPQVETSRKRTMQANV